MNACLDMIINLIRAHKRDDNCLIDGGSCIKSTHYLLGQIVRQYKIPEENYYISEAANNLWESLSDDNIWNYTANNHFVTTRDASLPRFVGSEKVSREIVDYKIGDKIEFNSVFHDEHIISIQEIVRQLDAIPDDKLDYDSVKQILDSIVLCRILKTEDKNLQHKRFATFEENYEKIYKPNGVKLISASEEYSNKSRMDL